MNFENSIEENIIELTPEEFEVFVHGHPEDADVMNLLLKNGINVKSVDTNVLKVKVNGSIQLIPTHRDYYLRLFDNVDKSAKKINEKYSDLKTNKKVSDLDLLRQYADFLKNQSPNINSNDDAKEWSKNVSLVSGREVITKSEGIFIDTCIEGAKLAIEELERRKKRDNENEDEINDKINKIINMIGKENL